ncbi:MAG: HEAT repeat domain-containing protein [Nitrospiraceae bacterium]|nr:MAG: HEAT repeat domain-containing protein [Nitrospiraceae bacterium]
MKKLISDYMENGFLDNIVDMFRHDASLYPLIGAMIEDERSRVRLGAVALVETLMPENSDNVLQVVPVIAAALKNPNPTIRGDAAYLLGIIGHKDALPFLLEALNDKHEMVREACIESVEAIKGGNLV